MGRRRGESDALLSVNAPRWLVIRDRLSHVLESHALLPHADLRAAIELWSAIFRSGSFRGSQLG
jgi:hypothetical protein